jgi:hypothetical protein
MLLHLFEITQRRLEKIRKMKKEREEMRVIEKRV